MQCTTEIRFLLCVFAALVAIVLPASAAELSALPASVSAAAGPPVAATAAAGFLLQDAPPPLIVMALGALLVTVTVTRRVRRESSER